MKILAVSSAGGHWEQLMILREGFPDCEIVYANTLPGPAEKSGIPAAILIPDCNKWRPFATILCALSVFGLVRRTRPDVVISTGAAPGLIALGFGRLLGARTIWVDSVANAERLSLCGRVAGYLADLWLTQWKHLETPDGPKFFGSVM